MFYLISTVLDTFTKDLHLLFVQVNEAVELLNDYNARLAAEMEERTKLAAMLRDFQAEQKELLAQAEQRLDVRC